VSNTAHVLGKTWSSL